MLRQKIPVTVITGFLGAGKTSLINQLLADHRDLSIGIVVNEFGEVGIDGALIDADEEAVVEINNGCVCCVVRADLVGSMARLLAAAPRPLQRLIIETSGLADPAPVLQTFLADPALRESVFLESVVTLVDAVNFASACHDDIAREQVAFADLVLLTKGEHRDAADRERFQQKILKLNPTAEIAWCERGATDAAVLGVARFSLARTLVLEPGLLDGEAHDHEHDTSVSAFCIVQAGNLDAARFERWMQRLVQAQGRDLLRMKGLLSLAGESRRFHFHGVHMMLETTPGKRWGAHEARETRLVFIGRNLDRKGLQCQFADCLATTHSQPGGAGHSQPAVAELVP